MKKIDPFYGFLKDLQAKDDGSLDYSIKNRMLNKYNKNNNKKEVSKASLSLIFSKTQKAA